MSRESRLSFKNQGALPQTLQALVWSELCFAKWLRHRIYLCGSLVRTLLRKVATPPHHGHDFRKRKLPLATAPSCAVSRSKHFATQNGLRPPRFLRGAYFAVHYRVKLLINYFCKIVLDCRQSYFYTAEGIRKRRVS